MSGVDPFVLNLTVFVLAIFVGYHVVWNVTPALPYAADGGDQRGVRHHHRRCDAGSRSAADGYRHYPGIGCGDAGCCQRVRRFSRHPAHAGYVQEEKK